MAKQKKDVKINVETGEHKIHVNRDESGLDAKYDGKNVDVEYTKNKEEKHFKYDGKKLDIEVNKTAEGTEVSVNANNGILKTLGNLISRIVLKRFKR
jgi:carbon monoxide dehydrogenase subunit G